jgi:hypothetical protein
MNGRDLSSFSLRLEARKSTSSKTVLFTGTFLVTLKPLVMFLWMKAHSNDSPVSLEMLCIVTGLSAFPGEFIQAYFAWLQ